MLEFGNFRAILAGPPRKAIIFDKFQKKFRNLMIKGIELEYIDPGSIPDTPRIPTLFWMNWAIDNAKKIAESIPTNPQGNKISVIVEVDADRPEPRIIFRDNNRQHVYTFPIMDFILRYTYVEAEKELIFILYQFFNAQQPLE